MTWRDDTPGGWPAPRATARLLRLRQQGLKTTGSPLLEVALAPRPALARLLLGRWARRAAPPVAAARRRRTAAALPSPCTSSAVRARQRRGRQARVRRRAGRDKVDPQNRPFHEGPCLTTPSCARANAGGPLRNPCHACHSSLAGARLPDTSGDRDPSPWRARGWRWHAPGTPRTTVRAGRALRLAVRQRARPRCTVSVGHSRGAASGSAGRPGRPLWGGGGGRCDRCKRPLENHPTEASLKLPPPQTPQRGKSTAFFHIPSTAGANGPRDAKTPPGGAETQTLWGAMRGPGDRRMCCPRTLRKAAGDPPPTQCVHAARESLARPARCKRGATTRPWPDPQAPCGSGPKSSTCLCDRLGSSREPSRGHTSGQIWPTPGQCWPDSSQGWPSPGQHTGRI